MIQFLINGWTQFVRPKMTVSSKAIGLVSGERAALFAITKLMQRSSRTVFLALLRNGYSLYGLHFPNIIQIIRPRRMKCVGHVAYVGERNIHILFRNS